MLSHRRDQTDYWNLILRLTLILITLAASHTTRLISSVGAVEWNYGENQEECDTEQTIPDAIILEPSDAWQRRIKSASPGETFLLREGTYEVKRDQLRPATGRSERWVTVKPYDCEQVTIWGGVRPQSYNLIAGLRIETDKEAYAVWVNGRTPVHQVVLRNNSMLGGTKKALLINQDARDIRVTGNIINGAKSGHSVWIGNWDSDKSAKKPTDIMFDHNLVKKDYFGDIRSSEDTLSIKTAGRGIILAHNRFTHSYNIENVIDIKGVADGPITIRNNYFDGPNLFLGSYGGNDSTGVCIVIGNEEKPPELVQHVIESNTFIRCYGGDIALGSGQRNGSALIHNNVFYHQHTKVITHQAVFARTFDSEISNNTFIKGAFKLGRSSSGCSGPTPENLVFKNNIFYGTRVIDQTDNCPQVDYRLEYNLLFDLPEEFERGVQRYNQVDDPGFVDVSAHNFRLKDSSPAHGAGEGGGDMGADLHGVWR